MVNLTLLYLNKMRFIMIYRAGMLFRIIKHFRKLHSKYIFFLV